MPHVSSLRDADTTRPYRARPAPPRTSTEVVVVGAGLAGLTAACELARRGVRTRILEAGPVAGGRVTTVDYGGGLRAEAGMQEIWANNPLVRIARELGVGLEPRPAHGARSAFLQDGRIRPVPDEGAGLTRAEAQALEAWMADAAALRRAATMSGLADARVRALQDLSGREWLERAAGLPAAARLWLRLHAEAELGAEWERFGALYALLEMECFFEPRVGSCWTVAGGNSRLVEALEAASGPVTRGARVLHIGRGGHARLRVRYRKNRRVHVLDAEQVVLAIPFHGLGALDFDPPLPQACRQALCTLGFGHYAPIHLVVDRTRDAHDVEVEGFLTHGPLGYVYGVVAGNHARATYSLLSWGTHARRLHDAPRCGLREVLAQLEAIRPGLAGRLREVHVHTHAPAAVPLWPPGRSPLDAGSVLLRQPVNGLHFAGDWLYGAHADAAARSGVEVAQRIAGEARGPSVRDAAPLLAQAG